MAKVSERQERNRSLRGLICQRYARQKKSSNKREHDKPAYTIEELVSWCFKQDLYFKLFDNWVYSDYDTNLSPSIDRIDSNLPYTLDNIQLMTWQENKHKGYEEAKVNSGFRVAQYDLDANFIQEFISAREASRCTKIHHISAVCAGTRKTAGGFKWRYLNG